MKTNETRVGDVFNCEIRVFRPKTPTEKEGRSSVSKASELLLGEKTRECGKETRGCRLRKSEDWGIGKKRKKEGLKYEGSSSGQNMFLVPSGDKIWRQLRPCWP